MLDKPGVATLLRLMFMQQQLNVKQSLYGILEDIAMNRTIVPKSFPFFSASYRMAAWTSTQSSEVTSNCPREPHKARHLNLHEHL